jgi:hypothetical protein
MYLDSHMHSEGLGFSELRAMAEAGIGRAVSLAFYPVKPLFPQTMVDLFRKLSEFETARCEAAGIKLYPAVGIHPRCIPPDYSSVIEFLGSGEWVAFGEIGLETAEREEIEVLKAQLEVAKEKDVPCIIHTPRSNKRVVTEKIISILNEVAFPEELAVIDHVNFENLDLVLKTNFWVGLTVQPGKLSETDVVAIVERHGVERFMLNSDVGFRDSDITAVARAARTLESKLGRDSEKVYRKNAEKFLKV